MFEKKVTSNANLDQERKFSYVPAAVKKKTVAHRIVLDYTGVKNAFDLAWVDLCYHYGLALNIKGSHNLAMRDLTKRSRLTKPEYFRKLENGDDHHY